MIVIKRDGTKEEFNADKIVNALTKAFTAYERKSGYNKKGSNSKSRRSR